MPLRIVLLSGRICTGKSTLAEKLVKRYGFIHFSTREFLRERQAGLQLDRRVMQNFGEHLDKKTKGAWVRDAFVRRLTSERIQDDAMIVVDSVRAKTQIDRFRESYRSIVSHVHLDCSDKELERRYQLRGDLNVKELSKFQDTLKNNTEANVPLLKDDADICIRTDHSCEDDVLTRVACHLGLHGRSWPQYVDVIVGGQYGSEGKGQIAAYLAPEYDLLVRVGGPNAGHKVFENPNPYTFHQLPSGTRCSNARLLIGPGAVINLDVLSREIAQCEVACDRLSIDPQATIIIEQDVKWEQKRLAGISSTAQGTGKAAMRRIERQGKFLMARGVNKLKPFIRPALEVLDAARRRGEKVMLEGTQGTGLSLFHGHYPFVTSRDTTASGCLAEAGIPPSSVRRVVMVCRTFPIRVQGKSGPMSGEIDFAEVSRRSKIKLDELERTERTSTTNRARRVGEFDWVQLRNSASLNAPTDIALTFADYLTAENRKARRVDQLDAATLLFIQEVERVSNSCVSLVSVGFNYRTVLDRRNW
jgi:adenylosuccinate synthase